MPRPGRYLLFGGASKYITTSTFALKSPRADICVLRMRMPPRKGGRDEGFGGFDWLSFVLGQLYIFESVIQMKLEQIQPSIPADIKESADDSSLQIGSLLNYSSFAHKQIFDGVRYPWEILPQITNYLSKYIQSIPKQQRMKGTTVGSVHIEQNVIIGIGTVIEHGAMIKGPAIIGSNCQLRKGAYVRGNVIVGDGCIIGNSTQLKNCVLLDKAQVCHFNYVGDSVLGEGAHLAAGAITSNLKLDQREVTVQLGQRKIPTGLMKLGAIVGDYAQIGCNVVLNPGSIIGRRSIVYAGVSVRGAIPSNHILKLRQQQVLIQKLV